MSTNRPAAEIESGTAGVAARRRSEAPFGLRGTLPIVVAFAIILSLTRGTSVGDAPDYAVDVALHLGKSPIGHGNSLWEFGHVLWRPLGWVVTSVVAPILSAVTDWTPFMQSIFVLIAISMLSGIVLAGLWYRLVSEITGSPRVAFAVTLAMACSDGFLLYAHAGCPYVPGLLCLTLSWYFLRRGKTGTAAVWFALSALLWLPFILGGAALLLIAMWPDGWDAPLNVILSAMKPARAIRFTGVAAVSLTVVFGLAMAAREISSVQEAKTWYAEADHGWSQNIRVVRIATGLPRSLLYLGRDGILSKRYLRHDPYAPVGIQDLIKGSLWKIAAFALFVVCLLYELMRRGISRWPLLVILSGAGPVTFFAVFLFEPGSPERFLPALPFLIAATAWVLRDLGRSRRATQIVMAGFLICMVVNNCYSFSAPRVSSEDRETRARLLPVRTRLNAASVAVIATAQDKIAEMMNRSPFDSMNRPEPPTIYDVIEPATTRVLQWRQEFAHEVVTAWNRGGEVWISKRLLSARPRPDWNWVEGDDARVSWDEVYRFFAPLQADGDLGGNDGFFRLAQNEANRGRLAPLAALYHAPAYRAAAVQ